ncbi:MAG: carbamoyltransferase [Candidatus Peribacter sp.]|jgi:carbamoyltransferase|nr:carbamoyltransferase [Candidatus Peribacter sp.]MBT4393248.1 carbamoyltransferase [Candidatus Peribacter sp.]MBT4601143.1 carbamoyltransferase [Candidatus Peribacter sp.]MBT5148897.1 carbamoyltransferase [Candidatus Peribacter sp.]MBT5637224.1 carbamoyltransferase [Candidatus Peribacter sp.]
MSKPTYILGLSCYYHDAGAVLLKDGKVVFAAQEERYTRKKQDDRLPTDAIAKALDHAQITIDEVDAIGFYEKPMLKFFDRILSTYFKTWPLGLRQYQMAMQEWMHTKLWIPQHIEKDLGYKGKVFYVPHHESHAASSFYCSGFNDSAVVTVDGVGEWATTTIGYGNDKALDLKQEIHFPHSLGLLYSAVTYYIGFKVNSAEYKVMGLAPYGEPKYVNQFKELIEIKDDGSFALNMKYFSYEHGLRMTGKKIEKLFGEPTRKPESELTQFHKDIAASVQKVTEEAMLKICKHAKEICPSENLCLAGGVALNCVANGEILRSGLFKDIFIQPAAGDAGGALGVALSIWHKKFGGERLPKMNDVYWGTEYSDDDVETFLKNENLPYEKLDESQLIDTVSSLLEGENVIGWFQGRMEFGPRALGNRSIIADARNKENWQKVNLKIKFRESFRPFAPTVLEENVSEYFDLDRESPYMLLVADVQPDKRDMIPAVTHVDGSARIQTTSEKQNSKYYNLIKAFREKTGCAVIINTSFNVRGEPIVESPKDALNCFLNTHMDYLVMGNILMKKSDMPTNRVLQSADYLDKFELD